MIENKELGVKFAESEEEAAWYRLVEEITQGMQVYKARISNAERDLKMADREISKRFRSGAKQVIKQTKQTILIQQELLKFAESKIPQTKA